MYKSNNFIIIFHGLTDSPHSFRVHSKFYGSESAARNFINTFETQKITNEKEINKYIDNNIIFTRKCGLLDPNSMMDCGDGEYEKYLKKFRDYNSKMYPYDDFQYVSIAKINQG